MKFGMKYATMTAEDHAVRARAYACAKAEGLRQRGRKTQKARATEVAAVVTAAVRGAGLRVEDRVSEPIEQGPEMPERLLMPHPRPLDEVWKAASEHYREQQEAYWKRGEEREKAGGYYVVRHDYKHGPMPEVEYMPTPAERVAWKLPGGSEEIAG